MNLVTGLEIVKNDGDVSKEDSMPMTKIDKAGVFATILK